VTVEEQISQADDFSERIYKLMDGKVFPVTDRHELCSILWVLILAHHNGMNILLHRKCYPSAFALMRSLAEAFLRLHLVTDDTTDQVRSIKDRRYSTDYVKAAKQIDKIYKSSPLFGPWFKNNIKRLHDLSHGGIEHLRRLKDGSNIAANYSEKEIRSTIRLSMIFTFLGTLKAAEFLGYDAELMR
jgi:hypothetical protein